MAQILPLLLFCFLLTLLPSFSIATSPGIRIHLTHIDSKLNLTKPELLKRAIERTNHRIASLTTTTSTDIQAPVQFSSASYQMGFSIGTPSLPTTWLLDTGSDLIWTQCKPCIKCFDQNTQLFDPSKSTTFKKLACAAPLCQALAGKANCNPDCHYRYGYAGGTVTQGVLASETFTFGSDKPVTVPGIGFGCSDNTQGGDADGGAGLVGFGRGKLSLVSQLGSGKFSYCLTSFGESTTSQLLLGSLAVINGSARTTPFIQNPSEPTLYYLSLQGITVGSTLLPIPSTVFALNSDGSGGFVIDSGTTVTGLNEEGYQVLKQEFQAQMNLSVADGSGTGFDLCFKLPADPSTVRVPELVFHFDGADMEFPARNLVIGILDRELLCLVMLPSRGISILGNFQQQNMHILYDLDGGKLSFEQTQCDQV